MLWKYCIVAQILINVLGIYGGRYYSLYGILASPHASFATAKLLYAVAPLQPSLQDLALY